MKPLFDKLKERGITPNNNATYPMPVSTPLVDAIKGRAAHFQKEWDRD
jgi:hypothetical protein